MKPYLMVVLFLVSVTQLYLSGWVSLSGWFSTTVDNTIPSCSSGRTITVNSAGFVRARGLDKLLDLELGLKIVEMDIKICKEY